MLLCRCVSCSFVCVFALVGLFACLCEYVSVLDGVFVYLFARLIVWLFVCLLCVCLFL